MQLAALLRNRTALLIAGAGGVAGLALLMSRRDKPGSDEPAGWTYADPGGLDQEVSELRSRVEDLEDPPVPDPDRPRPPKPPQVPIGPAGPTGPNRNPGPRAPAPRTKPRPPRKPAPAPKRKPRTYTVRSGDTLSGIAHRYRIAGGAGAIYSRNVAAIERAAKAHGYRDSRRGNLIFPGTRLRLP